MIHNNPYLTLGWIEVWYWYCYINILKHDINALLWFYFASVFYLNKYYRIYKKKKRHKKQMLNPYVEAEKYIFCWNSFCPTYVIKTLGTQGLLSKLFPYSTLACYFYFFSFIGTRMYCICICKLAYFKPYLKENS